MQQQQQETWDSLHGMVVAKCPNAATAVAATITEYNKEGGQGNYLVSVDHTVRPSTRTEVSKQETKGEEGGAATGGSMNSWDHFLA